MAHGAVRRLPNVRNAVIEERRIREYVLNLDHPAGGPKARFFIGHGFTRDAWVLLRDSLTACGYTRMRPETFIALAPTNINGPLTRADCLIPSQLHC